MRWPEDADGWPLRQYSRHVLSRPHRWHVQEAGEGETLLLIHGAGGATQSWRDLFPRLAKAHHVVAMDLPGQGFTAVGARQRCGLAPMAEDLLSLVDKQGWRPSAVIGHSAGAAIALQMSLHRDIGPVLGLNPALQNFEGVAGWLFPSLAKILSLNPFSASIFTATATRSTVRRLIDGTGSRLDPEGLELYYRLATDRGHVDATLSMMAQWSLDGLLERLPQISVPVRFLTGAKDGAVPPRVAAGAAARLADARVEEWPGYGHLIHEEAPREVARWIGETLQGLKA
ncbi:alpha/beta fold hydrolase BchO [Histidinibacterium aquaticum]|uniref:Alpha/beta fold hydrolase n=1 Tax=Histidinibacterium aquaticum TaxID=2613962 RepID=A0A5J5GGH6_9RHOB|nr:alpha/beta fold hydrolase BchO [Histidinibacterium aquaticum]KAA9006838.1 alpha/beta fold hydrolase [Histidinibacterium aquaticum]